MTVPRWTGGGGGLDKGHDVRFCNNQHDPDLMPDSISSTVQPFCNHKSILSCCSCSANQISTECCLEITALRCPSNVSQAIWVSSSPSPGFLETIGLPWLVPATKAWYSTSTVPQTTSTSSFTQWSRKAWHLDKKAACRSTKRSTHARPGMHMQQCSAVLNKLPFRC